MKTLPNIFIHDVNRTDQFCFVIDNQQYYKFNGRYGIYEASMREEKKEYALRFGSSVEFKQVYGLFSGNCPNCGHHLVNVPVIKPTNSFACFCEHCGDKITPKEEMIVSILNVLNIHTNRSDVFEYEELDLSEEELNNA